MPISPGFEYYAYGLTARCYQRMILCATYSGNLEM